MGLVERKVQLVIAQIRQWCEERGPQAKRIWGKSLPQIQPNMNGRLLCIHRLKDGTRIRGFGIVLIFFKHAFVH